MGLLEKAAARSGEQADRRGGLLALSQKKKPRPALSMMS